MATYYVSLQGDNTNNGTAPTTAWVGVNYAVDNCAAGDTIYIAPGTYREYVSNGVSGTSGNIITIIGDLNCEKFVDIAGITPGLVRITQADADELGTTGNTYTWDLNAKTYITIKNIIVDGMGGSAGSSTISKYGFRNSSEALIVVLENCVSTAPLYSMYHIRTMKRCMSIGNYACRYGVLAEDCLFIGAYGAFYQVDECINCIGMGNIGFRYNDQCYNCMAIGGNAGYYLAAATDVIDNCVSIGCYYGVNDSAGSTVTNHYSALCSYGYGSVETTAPNYYSQCYRAWHSGRSGDAPVQGPVISFAIAKMRKIIEGFEPWLFKAFEGRADDSDITSTLTDILGRNRRNSSTGSVLLDIGPYEYSTFSGSTNSNSYYLNPPGINVQGRGEVAFQVAVPSGSSMTASVYVKTTDADYPPSVALRGISLYDTSITTNTDVGSSWADNTFQQLTVNTAAVVKDEMAELVLSGAILTTSSFSDINIQAKVL